MGFLLAVFIGIFLYYKYGGYATFDPTKQGEEAKAAIKPGMPWTTVIDICGGPPQEYHVLTPDPKTKMLREGAAIPFEAKNLESDIKNKAVPDGFVFRYKFSEQAAFSVYFSEKGNALQLVDALTTADLLQTRRR